MSKFLLHVDLSRRTLITRDGGTYSMPPLTLGDAATFALRALDRDANNSLVEKDLRLRTLRASIGPVLAPPVGGTFTLRFDTAHESPSIAFDATADALRATIMALPEHSAFPLAEVLPSADPGCWLLRFNQSGPVPLSVETNRLPPRSFVRVRAFEDNGRWWHELRLIQSPLAFSGSHERVLPDAPSIRRIRAGAPRVEGSSINTNEVQALRVPSEFAGTYYLQFDFRSSRLIGIEDGPDEIAAALNAWYASIRPCPQTRSYPDSSPFLTIRLLTLIGFFKPRFRMLLRTFSNFFGSRTRGFKIRMRSIGMSVRDSFIRFVGLLFSLSYRKSNREIGTGRYRDRCRCPQRSEASPMSCLWTGEGSSPGFLRSSCPCARQP